MRAGSLPRARSRWAFGGLIDRKSTRLNSSHANISYAVFCLCSAGHDLPSFPTRRSSDLTTPPALERVTPSATAIEPGGACPVSMRGSELCGVIKEARVKFTDARGIASSGAVSLGLRRVDRSEEHTSELQSRQYLVCRLLLVQRRT